MPKQILIVEYDVTGLAETEIQELTMEAVVQAESSNGHPSVSARSRVESRESWPDTADDDNDDKPGQYRNTCAFCDNRWGKCTCTFPEPDDEQADGFDYQGVWVVSPNVSVCGRFYVDPEIYYGDAYRQWARGNARKEGS